eukprot:13619-Eustigmatos_ZCMA.PRE.1
MSSFCVSTSASLAVPVSVVLHLYVSDRPESGQVHEQGGGDTGDRALRAGHQALHTPRFHVRVVCCGGAGLRGYVRRCIPLGVGVRERVV